MAYLQQNDLNHAIEQFRAGLVIEPDNPQLHYDLGLALKLKDDPAAAAAELERAEKLDPKLPDPPYTLGVLYMQLGRFAEAQVELEKATALRPDNAERMGYSRQCLQGNGRATEGSCRAASRHRIVAKSAKPPYQSRRNSYSTGRHRRCCRRTQKGRRPEPHCRQPSARQLRARFWQDTIEARSGR